MRRVLLPLLFVSATLPQLLVLVAQEKKSDDADDQKKPPVPLTAEAVAKTLIFSKETTRVIDHKTKSGLPDYAAAINEHFGQGVLPADNGAIPLYEAFGPQPEGIQLSEEFFEKLGMPVPPEDGNYFQPFGKNLPEEQRSDAIETEFDLAMKRPWTEEEFPRVAKWLKDNEKSVGIIIAGVSRPEYYSPIVPPVDDEGFSQGLVATLLPGIQQSRSVARYLICRVMLNIKLGNADAAWNDLVAIHRFGHMISKGPTLIEYLVGIAINGIASHGDLVFLDTVPLDAAVIARCRRDLANLPSPGNVVNQLDWTERMMYLDSALLLGCGQMDALTQSGTPEAKMEAFLKRLALMSVDWNIVMQSGNEMYDRMVNAMKMKTFQQREAAIRDIEADIIKRKENVSFTGFLKATATEGSGRAAVGKLMGDVLSSLMLPAISAVNKAHNRSLQVRHNLLVAFALADWNQQHGEYPESLEKLVPDYLGQSPVDEFTGKPLNYQRTDEGFLIYSVGNNQEDESGRSHDDEPSGDDLAVRIPIPKPDGDSGGN